MATFAHDIWHSPKALNITHLLSKFKIQSHHLRKTFDICLQHTAFSIRHWHMLATISIKHSQTTMDIQSRHPLTTFSIKILLATLHLTFVCDSPSRHKTFAHNAIYPLVPFDIWSWYSTFIWVICHSTFVRDFRLLLFIRGIRHLLAIWDIFLNSFHLIFGMHFQKLHNRH